MQVQGTVLLRAALEGHQREWFRHLLQAQALAGHAETTRLRAPIWQTIVGATTTPNHTFADGTFARPILAAESKTLDAMLTGSESKTCSEHLNLITMLPGAQMTAKHLRLAVAVYAVRYAGLNIAMTHDQWSQFARLIPWDDLNQTFDEYHFKIADISDDEMTYFNQKYLSTIPLHLNRQQSALAGAVFWLSVCQSVGSVIAATAEQLVAAHRKRGWFLAGSKRQAYSEVPSHRDGMTTTAAVKEGELHSTAFARYYCGDVAATRATDTDASTISTSPQTAKYLAWYDEWMDAIKEAGRNVTRDDMN